jgi:hypothetical protein
MTVTRLIQPIFCLITLIGCLTHATTEQENWIITVRGAGVVEFISPASLQTIGRIHFSVAPDSSGLNGVFASADGSMLYIEGPGSIAGSPNPKGCCSLYSIDLATLQTKMVASIWGSRSREAVVISEGLVYPASALTAHAAIRGMSNARLHLSPDRRWLFGVRNFRGPALDIYDLAREEIVRTLIPGGDKAYSWADGIWAGNSFYFYAATSHAAGRLWTLSPESTQLGEGVAIPAFSHEGCTDDFLAEIAASEDRVFLYEWFGGKMDRRRRCGEQIPGGAWIVDPTTGRLLNQVAPTLHFSKLISNQTRTELYGLTSGHADSQEPVTLVRIDAHTGRVLQSRALDRDFWWIATARLKVVPSGDVQADL